MSVKYRFGLLYCPNNRHFQGYGKPMTVIALTRQEAINKAATVLGDFRNYKYQVQTIEEVEELHDAADLISVEPS